MIKRRKKGFTLAETVIAMTIMVLISLFATTSVFTFININKDSTAKMKAVNQVSNVYECFKTDDFDDALSFCYSAQNCYTLDASDSSVYWFYYDASFKLVNHISDASYKMKVIIVGNTFEAHFMDKQEATIYEMEKPFAKGDY